ncbi:interferon lambda-3, partial [Alligator sinensis]|uniref:Interferon lambda-3 n=1 Tax=Alligator sinensis TaxID=38654 RepID=A0A3Q0FPE6_ALLSI
LTPTPRTPHAPAHLPLCPPQGWAQLVLVEAELDRTVRVLQNLSAPQLAGKAARPLALLAGIRDELRRCIPLKAPAPRGAFQAPTGLRKRLQRIWAKSSQASRECLEKAAVLNLFRLLYKLVIPVAYWHTSP